MSYVSTTDVVSFQAGAMSILRNNGNANFGRPANTLLFGAGCHECVLLKIEVNEPSRTNRTHIASMVQDDLHSLQQNCRHAMFHQNQQ